MGDGHKQQNPTKFNNGNNIKLDDGSNTKMFNKLSFDDLASAHKMQNDSKAQFFQQPTEKNINSNIGPVPSFPQSDRFHGAPVYGAGSPFPCPQQFPQQVPNQYYMQPQFGPPNVPFPPQNFAFTAPNFPASPPTFPASLPFNYQPQQFNLPPPQQLNIPLLQGFDPQRMNR